MTENSQSKIMIVEDDDSIRELLHEFIEQEGFEVESFRNGADAITRLRANYDFKLVFFDMQMPIMDGRQFMAEFKRIDFSMPAATCLFTADRSPEDLAADLGCTTYMKKPVDLTVLRHFIANV